LALQPGDRIELTVDHSRLAPLAEIPIRLRRASGEIIRIGTRLLIETSLDGRMLAAGGLIPLILARHLGGESAAPSDASGQPGGSRQ
jgi:aconitate hydratase